MLPQRLERKDVLNIKYCNTINYNIYIYIYIFFGGGDKRSYNALRTFASHPLFYYNVKNK